MKFRTRFFIILLLFLAGAFMVYHFFGQNWSILGASKTFYSDFGKTLNDAELEKIVNENLSGKKGHFAVVVEELEATPSTVRKTPEVDNVNTKTSGVERLRRFVLNEKDPFPSASLYKLVLLAAVLKEVEANRLKLEDMIPGSKSNLTAKMGSLDFGYEEIPENFEFSVDEALTRVGRISDNFAAIMLTEKLRNLFSQGEALPCKASPYADCNDPLLSMAKELGMKDTFFSSATAEPKTTAFDIALFFKKLYQGEVVSKSVSTKIIEILSLNQINNRIPALLGEDVKVVHKTGELPLLRHDAGLVYLNSKKDYLIVLLSKDLQYEDDGVETLANISKGVFDYFSKKD